MNLVSYRPGRFVFESRELCRLLACGLCAILLGLFYAFRAVKRSVSCTVAAIRHVADLYFSWFSGRLVLYVHRLPDHCENEDQECEKYQWFQGQLLGAALQQSTLSIIGLPGAGVM